MMQATHQPLTSQMEEEELVQMSQLGGGADTRGSWLLHSESDSDDDEENANGGDTTLQANKVRRSRRRKPEAFLVSKLRHLPCFRLFFCCSRGTFMVILLIFTFAMVFAIFGMELQASRCWSAKDELFLLNRLEQNSANGDDGPWPLRSAHSHNDYQQTVPLKEALLAGFCSVEGDVYLLNGILYLGHMVAAEGTITLEDVYIKPLRDRIKANGGFVYRRSPRLQTCMQVTLLVDIKSVEILDTWEVLETLLNNLDTPQSDGRPLFETFDENFNVILPETSVIPSPLRVIVTGVGENAEAIASRMASRSRHKTSLDLNYESTNARTVKAASWISVKFPYKFPDPDEKSLAQTKVAITNRVKWAHKNGLEVRFWSTEELPELWDFLLQNGVDLINTDSIFTLHSYLVGRTVASNEP